MALTVDIYFVAQAVADLDGDGMALHLRGHELLRNVEHLVSTPAPRLGAEASDLFCHRRLRADGDHWLVPAACTSTLRCSDPELGANGELLQSSPDSSAGTAPCIRCSVQR